LKNRDYENKCKGYFKNHFSVLFLSGTLLAKLFFKRSGLLFCLKKARQQSSSLEEFALSELILNNQTTEKGMRGQWSIPLKKPFSGGCQGEA